MVGDHNILLFQVTGTPPFSVQWYNGTTPIDPSSDRVVIAEDGHIYHLVITDTMVKLFYLLYEMYNV